MAAEHDGLPLLEQQILLALGQGDHHLAGDGVRIFPGLVEDFSFQHGQQVKQRHLLQHPGGNAGHIVAGNIRPGENAVKGTVLVGYRHRGNGRIGSEFVPGQAHGNSGAQNRRGVEVQIPNLVIQIRDPAGCLEAEAVQHILGLFGDLSQAGGLIFPIAAGIAQSRIGDGRYDGIRVRIPVSGYINGIHKRTSICWGLLGNL